VIAPLVGRLAIVCVCVIGLSREGHVGQVSYEDIPLKSVVSSSANIVQAEFKTGKLAYYGYKVKSVLKGTQIKPGDTIRVVSQGTEAMKTMEEGRSPIFPSYPLKGVDGDPTKVKVAVLFLNAKAADGTYEFSVWPGYTAIAEIPEIQKHLTAKP